MDSNFEWGDPHNYAGTGLERQGGWSHARATDCCPSTRWHHLTCIYCLLCVLLVVNMCVCLESQYVGLYNSSGSRPGSGAQSVGEADRERGPWYLGVVVFMDGGSLHIATSKSARYVEALLDSINSISYFLTGQTSIPPPDSYSSSRCMIRSCTCHGCFTWRTGWGWYS